LGYKTQINFNFIWFWNVIITDLHPQSSEFTLLLNSRFSNSFYLLAVCILLSKAILPHQGQIEPVRIIKDTEFRKNEHVPHFSTGLQLKW